jgi:phosphate transport system permease protein
MQNVVIHYSELRMFGRATLPLSLVLDETMAVAFVLGNNHKIATSLHTAALTITVSLANEFNEADTPPFSSLYYLALVLSAMSFIVPRHCKVSSPKKPNVNIRD